MRKRVAIARALTLDPRYVLFDEPTTSLDPVSARRVDKLIRELSDTLGVTSIVVSHDLVEHLHDRRPRSSCSTRARCACSGRRRSSRAAPDGDRPAVHQRAGPTGRWSLNRARASRRSEADLKLPSAADGRRALDRGQGRRPHPRVARHPRRLRPRDGRPQLREDVHGLRRLRQPGRPAVRARRCASRA